MHEVRHDRRRRVAEPARSRCTASTRVGELVGQRRAVPARRAARRRPRTRASRRRATLYDAVEIDCSTRELERGRGVVDVHDLHRRRRAADARPGGRPVATAANNEFDPAPTTGAMRSRVATRPSLAARPLREQRVRTRRRGSRGGTRVRPQRRVLGERHRVVRPRAVHRRARRPHDLRTPAAAAASSTRRVPSTLTRVNSASSGIGPTIAARCTTVSTSRRYGARSAFSDVDPVERQLAGAAGRVAHVESDDAVDVGLASSSGSSRCPRNPETPVTATTCPRTMVHRLAQ